MVRCGSLEREFLDSRTRGFYVQRVRRECAGPLEDVMIELDMDDDKNRLWVKKFITCSITQAREKSALASQTASLSNFTP